MTQQEILIAIQNGDTSVNDELANYCILSFLRFSRNYFALRSITAIMHFPVVCQLSYQHLINEIRNQENEVLPNILQNTNLGENKLSRYLEKAVWKNYLITYIKNERKKASTS